MGVLRPKSFLTFGVPLTGFGIASYAASSAGSKNLVLRPFLPALVLRRLLVDGAASSGSAASCAGEGPTFVSRGTVSMRKSNMSDLAMAPATSTRARVRRREERERTWERRVSSAMKTATRDVSEVQGGSDCAETYSGRPSQRVS